MSSRFLHALLTPHAAVLQTLCLLANEVEEGVRVDDRDVVATVSLAADRSGEANFASSSGMPRRTVRWYSLLVILTLAAASSSCL